MQVVVETQVFAAQAKTLGISEEERESLTEFLARNPAAGDVIPGTGGA